MEDIVKSILDFENIQYSNIKKATSGFTNLVYIVDDYVVKMSNDEKIKKKLKKETNIYKNIQLNCIPSYIASGEINNYQYLIISRVEGKSLYSIWHTLSKAERKNCVKQIAEILKAFNVQDYEFLSDEYKTFDWVGYITKELSKRVEGLRGMGIDSEIIDSYIAEEVPVLFGSNVNFALVYNDAHFDNFIYDNGVLSLIDFDRVRVCPIDYEMLIFKTMCDNPSKFASEEDEDKIKDEDYAGIYMQFKEEYPEMFSDDNVEKRIKVYQFNYLMEQAIHIKNRDWINELMNMFDEQKRSL